METVINKRKIFNLTCLLTDFFWGILFVLFLFVPPHNVLAEEPQVNISVQASVQDWQATTTPPLPPGGGGGGVVIPEVPTAKVIFIGRAYPNALVTLLKNETVAATFFAESSGVFRKEISAVSGGNQTFGLWAQDSDGRKSVTLSFSVSILANATTTISGIFISPTIDVNPIQVEKGKDVDILGQAFPESQIKIFVHSKEVVKDAAASKNGKWEYKLNTAALEEGEHQAKAKSLFGEGEQSSFSQSLSFLVLRKGALVCKGADLNFDNRVNITDFSILLYFWNQKKPANPCADINFDGIVNIVDFSIMMYWWTS
ncbi:MAG: dockerin type I repeat-containing protein [Candidatus Paceibacterota bacterium]|jgi:hypothetical protein|nr:dockerin type I repeat-containing protein [Candidatus Paceibacterota bacterium]MDD4875273.1 dockerin type I repeat-containing protein [Candidatus Paceibacterota bacterium]